MRLLLSIVVILVAACPFLANAQNELVLDTAVFEKAKVVEVLDQKEYVVPGTDTPTKSQTIRAEIVGGDDEGKTIQFTNDYTQLEIGAVFYARHTSNRLDGTDMWSVADPYRLDILIGLALVFLVLTCIFGGIQGIRGLASLGGSFVLIFWLLIPGILHGYSPILVSIGVSSLIIVVGSYITHGFNRTTSAAVLGMISTVVITGLAAFYVVNAAHLSGYTSEESVYLNFDTRGQINLIGLLFGGIMIGLLGVLYDIAIGQAVAIEELFRAGKHMTRIEVYKRGIRIGREHIGALVNTLAIAYVGAALPLLLLISNSSSGDIAFTLNGEVLATEIIRILIGSIGLILAVPITTLIASYMLAHISGTGKETSHVHHH